MERHWSSFGMWILIFAIVGAYFAQGRRLSGPTTTTTTRRPLIDITKETRELNEDHPQKGQQQVANRIVGRNRNHDSYREPRRGWDRVREAMLNRRVDADLQAQRENQQRENQQRENQQRQERLEREQRDREARQRREGQGPSGTQGAGTNHGRRQ